MLLLLLSVIPMLLSAQTAAPPGSIRLRNHFDADALLSTPGFFDFLVLGAPGEAEWKVTTGHNPPSLPNQASQVLTDRPADSIAAAVRRNAVFQDGVVSVAMPRDEARGGIVFRLAGEKDFLALLIDLRTGEARLTEYRNGRGTELARGKAALTDEWGVLSVTANGSQIAARWNQKPLLEATDPHPSRGRAGMATAGSGRASFDELVLEFSDK